MGKLLIFPGAEISPPSRSELVDEASELVMKEILGVFVEQEIEPGPIQIWHREVRNYFWRQEIRTEGGLFRAEDVYRWKHHWREQSYRYIQSKRLR